MHKIQKIGNILVITNVDTNEEAVEIPAGDVYAKVKQGVFNLYHRDRRDQHSFDIVKLPVDQCIDENDAVFTEVTLKAWSRENLSFSLAGSPASPTTFPTSIIGLIHRPDEPLDILHTNADNDILTGHNFAEAADNYINPKLNITLKDVNVAGRVWPDASIDIKTVLTQPSLQFFVWNHSGSYLVGTILDADSGLIRFQDVTRQTWYVESFLHIPGAAGGVGAFVVS